MGTFLRKSVMLFVGAVLLASLLSVVLSPLPSGLGGGAHAHAHANSGHIRFSCPSEQILDVAFDGLDLNGAQQHEDDFSGNTTPLTDKQLRSKDQWSSVAVVSYEAPLYVWNNDVKISGPDSRGNFTAICDADAIAA